MTDFFIFKPKAIHGEIIAPPFFLREIVSDKTDTSKKGSPTPFYAFLPNPKIPYSKFDDSKALRNQAYLDKQIVFVPSMGKKFFDVIMSTAAINLISEKVYTLLSDNKITGWKGVPAIIQGHEDLKYYMLTIIGRCGPIDYSKSVMVDSSSIVKGEIIKVKKGLLFAEESWDGSDMFVPENTNDIFVTERVKNLLTRSSVTNVLFTNIKENEYLPWD